MTTYTLLQGLTIVISWLGLGLVVAYVFGRSAEHMGRDILSLPKDYEVDE